MIKKILILNLALLFFVLPAMANGASLSVSPPSATLSVGDLVTARILVSGGDVSLNAISGDVIFSVSIFTIESVLKNDSVLNFWVTEPSFNKNTGVVHFEGVSLTGFKGNGGTVVTVVLRAIKEGTGSISFKNGQILANDGQGTDITSGLSGGSYIVNPSQVKEKVLEKKPEVEPKKEEEKIEAPQTFPTLTPPEIILSKKYGEKAIVGTSQYPGAQALVSFISNDGTEIFIVGKADEDGGFTVLVPKSLKRGEYRVTALMVENDGTNSPQSEKIKIIVGNIFSDLGIEFYITLGLLILVIIYLLHKLSSRYRKGLPLVVIREIKEAEAVVRKSFDVLRSDVKKLEKKTGKDAGNEIKTDLDDAENVIKKEIKDIDSI